MSKEIFLARISAMRSKQAKNSRAITQEDYDNIIKKLKLLEKKVKGKTIPGFTTNLSISCNLFIKLYTNRYVCT